MSRRQPKNANYLHGVRPSVPLKPRPSADPHFQEFQFDPSLPRGGPELVEGERLPSMSPEANAAIYGDKSLRSKIATLLSGRSVFEVAAFKT